MLFPTSDSYLFKRFTSLIFSLYELNMFRFNQGGGKELSGKREPLPSGKSNISLRTPTYPLVDDEIPLELTGFGILSSIPSL